MNMPANSSTPASTLKGRLYLVPAPLDFGCTPQSDLQDNMPLGTLSVAARLQHWVCENAKSTRAYLQRVDKVVPLHSALQALHIQELPREVHKKGDHHGNFDARPLLAPALAGKDIAHTMETFNAFSYQALRAKRRYGTKLVVTVWENRPYAAERFAAKRRMKYEVINGADLFLAMTPRAASCLELEGADPKKIQVLPPGINTERFKPSSKPVEWQKRLNLHPDDFVFLSVAALRWEKGVQDILHAFKKLTIDAPGRRLKLIFSGSGPEEKRLRGLAERISLGNQVIFARFPYEEMHAVYNLADVFLLASTARPGWLEQFGYVLAEALASGTPIITTVHGSIPEVVGEAALLVPPSDFLGLADAMGILLVDSNKKEWLSQAGRTRAEAEYDSRKQANRLFAAYEGLMR